MKTYLIILFLLLSLISNSATYYLAPTGNDTTGDGSISSPWFTINKAWTVVAAGDIVYMRDGTFAYNSQQRLTTTNGNATDTIKVFAYPGEQPNVTKSGSYTVPGFPNGLIYISSDYIYLKGIEVSGYTPTTTAIFRGIVLHNATNNKLERINSHHNGHGLLVYTGSTNNLILNCDLHHNYDPTNGYGDGDGIELADIGSTAVNTIRGCRFYYNADDGLDLWNNDGYVTVDNCWSWMNGYREDGVTTGGDGNGLKLGRTTVSYSTEFKRTITNNLSFFNRTAGINQNQANCKMYFYNNTVYANLTHGFWFFTYDNANILRNNVSFSNVTDNYVGDHVNATVDHSNYDAIWQPTGVVATSADFVSIDTTGVSGARQVNGDLPDLNFLKLTSGSDLIDAGINVGLPYSGTAPDLGAFEYTDITDPIVTAFTIPATSSSLIVTISSFTATDNIGVAGYLLTESATTPSPSEGLWSATAQTNYVFTTEGAKTLYAWAKDAEGNVSSSLNDSVVITVTPPTRVTATHNKLRTVYHKKASMN